MTRAAPRLAWLAVCAALVGCGGDEPSAAPHDDAAVDATIEDVGGAETDGADSETADTGRADTDSADIGNAEAGSETGNADTGAGDTGSADTSSADTGSADTGSTDTGSADTGSADTGSDAGATRRGQCFTNAHCPSGSCRAGAPGGICECFGSCPTSAFECTMGACVRDCSTDADCYAGMRCHPTQFICALRTCSSDAGCAPTTVCRPLSSGGTNYCMRKLCPDDTGCPAGTTCRTSAEGKSCVEDSLTFE